MNSNVSRLVSIRKGKMNRLSIHKLESEGSKREDKKTHIVIIVFVGRLTLSGRHFDSVLMVFPFEILADG